MTEQDRKRAHDLSAQKKSMEVTESDKNLITKFF